MVQIDLGVNIFFILNSSNLFMHVHTHRYRCIYMEKVFSQQGAGKNILPKLSFGSSRRPISIDF